MISVRNWELLPSQSKHSHMQKKEKSLVVSYDLQCKLSSARSALKTKLSAMLK